MTHHEWNRRWELLQAASSRHTTTDAAIDYRFTVEPPSSETDVAVVEGVLGYRLPQAFRTALLSYSSHIEVFWQLPDSIEPPRPFQNIFAGHCYWSLKALPDLAASHRRWLTECFDDPSNDYDAVWHGKVPFMSVGNGDMVAIDPESPGQPVVYLSHDDGEGHGFKLGDDFADYIDRASALGCPGAEDWQWLPFVSDRESGLCPDGENGRQWRAWFGLP